MADVNSNINIHFNTADALAQLRRLQAGLSKFHQTLAEGNLAAANAQKGLNAQLMQSIGATGKFAASQVKVASSTLAFTSALEKNKLSLREYYRYSMAAATANTKVLGRAFAQEREIINRARRDRVKALQAQYIQMARAQGGFIDAMRVMPRTLMMANGRFTELGTRIQYAAQRQQLLNQLLRQGSTQLLNFGKNTQWAGRQLMVGLTMPLMLLGGYASKAFRDVEKATVKFTRVYGDAFTNEAQVNEALDNIKKLADGYTKYGVAIKDTIEMAATAAAAGFQGEALQTQVDTATKLAVLGQIEQQQALETTISLQNAFGISTEELATKINFLNAVENQTVLSIEDLTIAIPKAAPIVKQLGGTVEDLAFFLTAMKEGGINASEGANALKSGLASLINPTEKASKMLGEMGVNIKGIVEANKGDIKATVVGFARALDTLDPLNRARAIEQLFGKFQFARLSTLFQNVSKEGTQAARAFDLAGASVEELAVLSEREMAKVENAVGTKFQSAVEQFKKDIMPLGKAFLEAVTPVVKFFGGLFEKFNNLGDQTKKVIAIIIGVVAGLGPVLLMTFGLLANGLANLIKLFATIRGGIAKLNGQTSVLGAGFNYVTQEQLEQQAASQALHNTHTKLVEVFNIEKIAVQQLGAAYLQAASQARALAQSSPSLFASPGAAAAVSKLPKGTPPVRRYSDGVLTVPGPKGAGDVQPAMLAPGEAVIPADVTAKNIGFLSAMMSGKIPGHMAGRLPKRPSYHAKPEEQQSGSKFLGMPKSLAEARQSREIVNKISEGVMKGQFGKVKPTNFGTLLEPFSGRSFPIPGVGGVYRKPSGELVVVKPTIDEKTALAEVRATQIARDVHGLVSPKQKIRTMIDPTDPAGKRKLIVLESPYDNRIIESTGKFTQKEMATQLVASTLRADKDLSPSNVFGKVLADPGTAGVFARASGFRDYQTVLPGMGEMGMINLLGVKGGAKKFFAQETSSLAAKMTPKQYEQMIIKEIDKSLPKLRKLIDSWSLNPVEKQVYENMYARLEAGKKVDWQKLHSVHVAAGKGVKNFEEGPGTFKPDQKLAQAERIARQKFLQWADEEIEKSNLDSKHKKRWTDSAKNTFREQFLSRVKYDPVSQTWWTLDKKGKQLGSKGVDLERLKERFTYRYGITPDPVRGTYVSSNFFNATRWLGNITGGGQSKRGADISSRNPKVRKIWEEIKQEARLGATGVNEKSRRKYLSFLSNLTDADGKPTLLAKELQSKDPGVRLRAIKRVDKLFTIHAAHKQAVKVADSLEAARQGKFKPADATLKYHTGIVGPDLGVVNEYVKTNKASNVSRFEKILDWNSKSGNPLRIFDESPYRNAIQSIVKEGNHPFTQENQKHVKRLAELEISARDALAKNPKAFNDVFGRASSPYGYDNAKLVNKILGDRIADSNWYQRMQDRKMFVQLDDVDENGKLKRGKGVITARKAEYYWDESKQKFIPLTGQNTVPVKGLSGQGTETRTPDRSKTGGGPIATKQQVKAFRRDDGDPKFRTQSGGKYLRLQRERQLIAQGRSQSEIAAALKAQAKHDQKEAKRKAKAAKAAANADSKAALAAKDQAYRANKAALDKVKLQNQINKAHAEALVMHKQFNKDQKQQRKQMRQEKVGRWSGGASMALGTAGMAAMMSGNTGMGMGLMGVSAVAGMAPMFAGMGPVGWITTAAITVGGGLFLLNKHLENAAKKQAKYVESVSATTDKMEKIGAITDKVGASRAMEEVRSKGSFNDYNDVRRAGTRFGDTFLQSDVGKSMAQGFVKNMQDFGSKQASENFALQLATYISDGVLTPEQAASIAEQIGVQLGNRNYALKIQANVESLIGPNGEDLKNNALDVRTKIIQEANDRSVAELAALTQTGGRDNAARIAALSLNNIEIAKAQNDATEWQYRKQIQILQKQLAQTIDLEKQLELKTKIAELEGKMADDTKVTQDLLKKQIQSEMDTFKNEIQNLRPTIFGGDAEEDAYFDALKATVQEKFKDTFPGLTQQLQKELASLSNRTDITTRGFTSGAEAQQFEVFANLMMGQGFANPQQFKEFMNIYSGDEGTLYKDLQVGVEAHGPQKTFEMLDFFTGFENKDVAKTIYTDIINKDPEQFDKIGKALAQLSVMDGHEINMEAFIKAQGIDGLEKLSNDLAKIEEIDTPITKEVISKLTEQGISGITEGSMATLMSQWKDWDALPDVAKKEAISKYKTVYDLIFSSPEAKLEWARKIAAEKAKAATKGLTGTAAKAVGELTYNAESSKLAASDAETVASEAARTYVGEDGKIYSKDGGLYNPEKDGGGKKEDPYRFLLTALKNVRNAGINAAGGIKALNAALADKGIGSAVNRFVGISQQLDKIGTNRQFTDFLMNLEPEEQGKYFKTVGGKKDKKGRLKNPVTGKFEEGLKRNQVILTELGKKYNAAFDLKVVGDYNDSVQRSVDLFKAQDTARTKLLNLGYDQVTVERMIQDENIAIAVASGKITEVDIERNSVLTKEAVLREKINGLISRGTASVTLMKNVDRSKELVEFFNKLKGEGIAITGAALRDVLSDPEMLDEAIAAMDQYKSSAGLAQDKLKQIVENLNAIKAASNIKFAMEFANLNTSEKVQKGYEAAKRQMDAKKTLMGYMTPGEISSGISAVRKDSKGNILSTTPTGKLAIQNVGQRYKDAGLPIPDVAGVTLKGVQKQRAQNAKTLGLAQERASQLQDSVRSAEDALSTAQDNLENAIENENKRIDDLIKKEEDKIASIEKQIQINYEDKIDAFNQESNKLSNDLAIMDHAADQINKKYDKQLESLEEVQRVNDSIIRQQQQQVGLADALTQGDIGAAARAAQEMRASNAADFATSQTDALNQARENELGALRGAQTGMTREQISERQFVISQEIYKLETDPERLKLEQQIKDIKQNIANIEAGRAASVEAAAKAAQAAVDAAKANLDVANKNLQAQELIVKKYQEEEDKLKAQEEYLQSIVDEAIDLDDSTGMTLEKWQETADLLPNIEELARDYAASVMAAEEAAANGAASWQSTLDTIKQIPESVTTNLIINEIRNITEYITQHIHTIYSSSGNNGSGNNGSGNNGSGNTGVGDRYQTPGGMWYESSGGLIKYFNNGGMSKPLYRPMGGIIPYFLNGGFSKGTDTVPAMLTPGEFVMSRYAVDAHGVDKMKAINNGTSVGESVYNYSINVNVKSDANPDEIARAVMTHIQRVNSQTIRGVKIS